MAILPVDRSQVDGNVRSVRLPFWLKGMAPSGSVAAPVDPVEADPDPDDVAAGFLSSLLPATRTTVATMAITTTMAAIGP